MTSLSTDSNNTSGSFRLQLSLGAIILVLISLWLAKSIRPTLTGTWATIVCSPNLPDQPPAQRIATTLRQAPEDGHPKAGALVPIVTIVKPDGRSMTVTVLEAEFDSLTIDPAETFAALPRPIALVNSVDERESLSGGISGKIGAGCALTPSADDGPLQKGQVRFLSCNGPYKKLGITTVINAAIVVWKNPDSQERACWDQATESHQNYEDCIQTAVSDVFKATFSVIGTHKDIRSLVIPALATGTGDMSKEKFYQTLSKNLLDALTGKNGSLLPDHIYLLVWRKDKDKWGEARTGIAKSFSSLYDSWISTSHSSAGNDRLQLCGVFLGMALVMLAAAWLPFLSPFYSDLQQLRGASPLTYSLGWIAAALGLTSVLKYISAAFDDPAISARVTLAIGFSAVLLCGPLLRMFKRSKSGLEA